MYKLRENLNCASTRHTLYTLTLVLVPALQTPLCISCHQHGPCGGVAGGGRVYVPPRYPLPGTSISIRLGTRPIDGPGKLILKPFIYNDTQAANGLTVPR